MTRASCRALGKSFSEGQRRRSAKKSSRQRRCSVDGVFAECRQFGHSAKTFFIFFRKLFAECHGGKALGKDIFYFFKKNSLPSASPAWHSAKIFCFFLKKKSLPSAMSWHSAKFPSFAECHDHCTRQINRNCKFFFVFCIPLTQTVQIYITCHIYITTKPFSHIISQPQLK